jgi:prepilin-type N-terminal cleavage/methylation domain-containing protein
VRNQEARYHGFTLIELLIVVAIISILTAIALPNFMLATRRSEVAKCCSNLKTIAYALYAYRIDYNRYPLADGVAGPEPSPNRTEIGNGPAANGSWDGVPRILVTLGYLSSDEYLFCPTLKKHYRGRVQNFRYAYNSSAYNTGGPAGGADHIEYNSGDIWHVRCLWVPYERSFKPSEEIPYPHGETREEECVLFSNSRVELRNGRQDFYDHFNLPAP